MTNRPTRPPAPDAQCLQDRATEAQRNAYQSWTQYHRAIADTYQALLADDRPQARDHHETADRHQRQAVRLERQSAQLLTARPCRCGECVDYRPQALRDAR